MKKKTPLALPPSSISPTETERLQKKSTASLRSRESSNATGTTIVDRSTHQQGPPPSTPTTITLPKDSPTSFSTRLVPTLMSFPPTSPQASLPPPKKSKLLWKKL